MARERRRFHLGHVLAAAFLLIPPAAQLTRRHWEPYLSPAGESGGKADRPARRSDEHASRRATLEAKVSSLREEVRLEEAELARVREELKAIGALSKSWRFEAMMADVLPVRDPSARRNRLLVAVRGARPTPRDSVAVWERSVVGRVVEPGSVAGLAMVQTILDPGFRAWFRSGESEGILHGTGKVSADGFPLLNVRHRTGAQPLAPGQTVFTHPSDSLFPPGCVLGVVADAVTAGQPTGQPTQVRAPLQMAGLSTVVLFVDRARHAVSKSRWGRER